MQLDDTDRRLLAVLLEDARISQRGLAQRIGVAQGTITNRLRRLERQRDCLDRYRRTTPNECPH